MHNRALNRFRVGGRGTVCLSHVVYYSCLNDEMHMGRNVRGRKDCLFFLCSTICDYIIHTFNNEIHMRRNVYNAPSANTNLSWW